MMHPPSLLPPPPVVLLPVPHKTMVQPPVSQPDNTTDTFTPTSKQAKPKPTWQPWAIGAGIVATLGIIAITQQEHLQTFIKKLFPKAEEVTVSNAEKTVAEVPKPPKVEPTLELPKAAQERLAAIEQNAERIRNILQDYYKELINRWQHPNYYAPTTNATPETIQQHNNEIETFNARVAEYEKPFAAMALSFLEDEKSTGQLPFRVVEFVSDLINLKTEMSQILANPEASIPETKTWTDFRNLSPNTKKLKELTPLSSTLLFKKLSKFSELPIGFFAESPPSYDDFNTSSVGKAFEAKMGTILSELFELEEANVVPPLLNSHGSASVAVWQKTLEQSDSSIFPKMLDYFKSYKITDKRIDTIPSTFVNVFLKASADFTQLEELLYKIENYPQALFNQQTPEAKEAFATVQQAFEAFIDVSEHPETSPMFRWVGDYANALLSLKMGDAGLALLPDQLRLLDEKMTKGYEAYNHIKEQLPALLLDSASSSPLLTEWQVTYFWPEEVEILHYGLEEKKANATHEALVEQLKTAKIAFDVAAHQYYDVGNNRLASTGLRWEVSRQYRNAGQNLTNANRAVVEFRNKHYLATEISPEQVQTATQAREYFGTTVEQWTNLNIHNTPPRLYINPENVNVLYQEVKKAFFFEAMFKMLQKQIDTLSAEQIETSITKGLVDLTTALTSLQNEELLKELTTAFQFSDKATIPELLKALTPLEEIRDNLINPHLGLAPEVANSIEKSKRILALHKLIGLQKRIPNPELLQILQQQVEAYDMLRTNLRTQYVKTSEPQITALLPQLKASFTLPQRFNLTIEQPKTGYAQLAQ